MYLRRSEDTVDNHVDVLVLRDVQGLNNWFRLFVWLILIMENLVDQDVSLQKSSKIPLDWWRREGWSSQEEEKESTSLEPPSAPAFNCQLISGLDWHTLFSPIMFGPFHQIYLDVLGYFTLEKEFFIFLSGKFFCKDIFWSQTSNLISAAMRLYLRNQNE